MNVDADCHELVHTYVSTGTICDNSWCSPHVSYFASSEHGEHDVAGCQYRFQGTRCALGYQTRPCRAPVSLPLRSFITKRGRGLVALTHPVWCILVSDWK